MRKHPTRLAEVGISPERYRELRSICGQYREMKQEMPGAIRYCAKMRRVRIIEQAAMAARGEAVGKAVLKSVTQGKRFAKLRPPCGERQFYEARLDFFVELDRRLWEHERGKGM